MHDDCHHGHPGHSHSHGPRAAAFGGMANLYMPAYGQLAKNSDQTMDINQQPKKRSLMDDSSSWDIIKATQFGILERCKELVEAGYDVRQPDKENVSLLHWAAINNRSELVKYYISKGAIIDQLGGDLNSSPLHWAIRQGHLPMVIQLMRYGADPSITDGEGYRALHLAILFQHMAIAAYLMAKGQEVDLPDCNGQTPLMLAAQKIIGPEPTNFLIKNNASVNAVDKVNRNTPLHCAVLAGNVDAAHILLEAGASVDAENINGHTPIDLAHQVHSPLLIHMLSHVKQERIRSNSRCLRFVNRYKVKNTRGAAIWKHLDKISCLLFQNVVVLAEAGCLDPRIFCTSCMIRKPVRATHCFSCDACVAKQDHHSIWTNTCIGARNHCYFVLLLLSLMLMGSWMLYGCLMYWSIHCNLHYKEQGLWGFISALVGCSPWVLSVFLLSLYHTCWSGVALLLQLYQISFLGLTTAERATLLLQQRKLRQPVSMRQNPFNLGVVQNLVSFFQLRCCGLFKPTVTDWTSQFQPHRDQYLFDQTHMV
uniref:Palmitoyltransferase n=1 Tax=Nothobranchius furzeri TaxID=105023 RepID=A0A8C6NKZ8_NOTFU